MGDGDERVATNLRTLLIVEALSKSERPLTPTEINEHVGLPKQSIHRLCNTLIDEGFLVRDADPKLLRPSPRLVEIAAGLQLASRSHIARHQVLEGIARKVGETVNFVVPDEKGMTYKDRVETDWPLRIQLPIGSHVPFHCTASGKTFLAGLPPRQRETVVRALDLERHAANTITTVDAMLDELKAIRKAGYAVDNEEFKDGMVAVAVPVNNPDGRFYAAVAFHAPMQRMSRADAIALVPVLENGARMLEDLLG